MAGKPRKRYGKPLDLLQLQVVMSQTLRYLVDTIDNEELTQELRLRACSAFSANAGVYAKLLESNELEKRLSLIEQRMEPN